MVLVKYWLNKHITYFLGKANFYSWDVSEIILQIPINIGGSVTHCKSLDHTKE